MTRGKLHDSTAASSSQSPVYRFGNFVFHARSRRLQRAGQSISLPGPATELLAYLLAHPDRTISQKELISAVWQDTVVSEGTLRLSIWEVRRALGDSGSDQAFVQTERGRGYRFVGASCAEPSAAPIASQATLSVASALVGRAAELAQLERAARHALGLGQCLILVGPPGVGKSRLACEALVQARSLGYACVWGHTEPAGAAPPLGPWLEMLKQRLEQDSGAALERCERLTPLAWAALQSVRAHPGIDSADRSPEQQRSQLFNELAGLFISFAAEQPLLLLLEDLQWADEASLAFFVQLTRALSHSRILLLVTSRPSSPREHGQLSRAVSTALREPHSQKIELRGLSVEETHQMLGSVSDRTQLATHVHTIAHGNPLHTLEFARLLRDTDEARREDLLRERHLEVNTIIGKRMEKLTPDAQDVLRAASVLAHDFALANLAAVADKPAASVLAPIDECLEHGLLTDPVQGRFSFTHPLIRDATYESLARTERCELHRRAGAWIEQQGRNLGAMSLAQLARHFYYAAPLGVAEKAVLYARRAAESAVETTAYATAVTYYDHALECAELVPGFAAALRIELGIERALALRAARTTGHNVPDLLAQLADEASAHAEPELFARAVLAYSGEGPTGFMPARFAGSIDARELDLLERALDASGEAASPTRVMLLCALAFALVYSSDRVRRSAICDEAVALARVLKQPKLLARALLFRTYACAAPDAHGVRLRSCDELVDVTERHGLKALEVEARMTRAVCLLEVGKRQRAEQDESRAARLAQELGTPRLRVRCELMELFRAFQQGDLQRTDQLAQRCYQANPNNTVATTLYMVRSASIKMLRDGMTADTLALHENLVASYPDTMGFHCALANAYAAFGRTEAAAQQFDWVARDGFAALPQDINWLAEMSLLAETAVYLDDRARARLVYEQLEPYGDRWPFYAGEAVPTGPTAHWLAELAITERDAGRASFWLARARELSRNQEAPMFIHINMVAEARFLLLFEPEGGSERAAVLIRDASLFADKQGLHWLKLAATHVPHRPGLASTSRADDTLREPSTLH